MIASVMCGGLAMAGEPVVHVETGAARAEITVLSWDIGLWTERSEDRKNKAFRIQESELRMKSPESIAIVKDECRSEIRCISF